MSQLLERAREFCCDRVSDLGRASATERPVQVVYLVAYVAAYVANGGIAGWVTNADSAWDVLNTAGAYDEIGATRCASIIREALDFFPGAGVPDDLQARADLTFSGLPMDTDATWGHLGDEILALHESIDSLLASYIVKHPEVFASAIDAGGADL